MLMTKQRRIPLVVIRNDEDRSWTGGLVQAEGCNETHYVQRTSCTTIVLGVAMTDPAPVFKFSDVIGLPRPLKSEPSSNPDYLPRWRKEISGLRAYRVLGEILPFLVGEKSREAQKALQFFAPYGIRRGGWFSSFDVWPPNQFPLRKRRVPLHEGTQSGETSGSQNV